MNKNVNIYMLHNGLHGCFELGGPKQVVGVITGDETWVPLHDITRKRRKNVWLGANDQRHQICRPRFQSRKNMLTIVFKQQLPVALMFCLLTAPL